MNNPDPPAPHLPDDPEVVAMTDVLMGLLDELLDDSLEEGGKVSEAAPNTSPAQSPITTED